MIPFFLSRGVCWFLNIYLDTLNLLILSLTLP